MADTVADKTVHSDYAQAPEVHDGMDDATTSAATGPSSAAQALEWARREAAERGTYLVAEVRRRPWQSAALMLSIWCLLGQLIALSSSWLEFHVVFPNASSDDIAAHADLSHVWSCQRRVRTAVEPGYDCDIYSLGDAPRNLDGLGAATGAAAAFSIIGFLLCIAGVIVVALRRLDRTDALGTFATTVGSKTGAVTLHALASFSDMIAFSAYSGGTHAFLSDSGAMALVTRNETPTAVYFGAGFAFAILGWLILAACAYVIYHTPTSEEFVPVPRTSPVGTGAAPAFPDEGAATAAGAYSAPLTGGDDDDVAVTAAFGGSIGGDDDAAAGADDHTHDAEAHEGGEEPSAGAADAAEDNAVRADSVEMDEV